MTFGRTDFIVVGAFCRNAVTDYGDHFAEIIQVANGRKLTESKFAALDIYGLIAALWAGF
ncbi:MAG: hypothetical protein GY826_25810 [Fuerstiella sp.]|nr:hypothetical protein [Fuerstiella sp.]